MATITQTMYDPYREQQYNLALLQGFGQLAQTGVDIYKDYRQQKKEDALLARQRELDNQKIGIEYYTQGIKSKDENLIRKGYEYLGFSKEDADKTLFDWKKSISLSNTRKTLAYENIGNLFVDGTYKIPKIAPDEIPNLKGVPREDLIIKLSPEERQKLIIPTLANTEIPPAQWGPIIKSMYGERAFDEANMNINQAEQQEYFNLTKAVQAGEIPEDEIDDQIMAITMEAGIRKAKILAARAGIQLPDGFGKKYIEKNDYQNAKRKKALGKDLDLYEQRLVNEFTEAKLDIDIKKKQLSKQPIAKGLAKKSIDELLKEKASVLKAIKTGKDPSIASALAAIAAEKTIDEITDDEVQEYINVQEERLSNIDNELEKKGYRTKEKNEDNKEDEWEWKMVDGKWYKRKKK